MHIFAHSNQEPNPNLNLTTVACLRSQQRYITQKLLSSAIHIHKTTKMT
jgi:hypothetical protein